jgi:hypothetical protein
MENSEMVQRASPLELLKSLAVGTESGPASAGLFEKFGYKYKEGYDRLAMALTHWPETLQTWAHEKKLGFFDLELLSRWSWTPALREAVHRVLALRPSRQVGLRLFETLQWLSLCEGARLEELLQPTEPWSSLARVEDAFFEIRYPQRHLKQRIILQRSAALSWPKGTFLKWDFSSDRPTAELSAQIRSLEELRKLHEQLGLVLQQASTEDRNPWI